MRFAFGEQLWRNGAALLRHYDPNRFKTSLKRTNPEKGPGIDPRWVSTSWEETLDIVVRELKRVRDEDPRKLLPTMGERLVHTGGWGASHNRDGNGSFRSMAHGDTPEVPVELQ